ncbi:MAG: hypothetical protein AB7C89_07795 [Intestinibacillus sp.]
MKNGAKKAKRYFGLGFLMAGAAVGAGATLFALVKRQKREQVYHEAELKAMNELDDLMAENESACAGCAAGDGACCTDGQISISEDEAQETAGSEEIRGEEPAAADEEEPQA